MSGEEERLSGEEDELMDGSNGCELVNRSDGEKSKLKLLDLGTCALALFGRG